MHWYATTTFASINTLALPHAISHQCCMGCGPAGEHVFCTQMPANLEQEEEEEEEEEDGDGGQALPTGELQQQKIACAVKTSEHAEGATRNSYPIPFFCN